MLGPAELREIDEALSEERETRAERRSGSPYLMPHFAVGLSVTRAVAGGLKTFDPLRSHG